MIRSPFFLELFRFPVLDNNLVFFIFLLFYVIVAFFKNFLPKCFCGFLLLLFLSRAFLLQCRLFASLACGTNVLLRFSSPAPAWEFFIFWISLLPLSWTRSYFPEAHLACSALNICSGHLYIWTSLICINFTYRIINPFKM